MINAFRTDTTMLIWKTISANPGITRTQIWEQVEHGIPAGYALRLHSRELTRRGRVVADASATTLQRARGFVLYNRLNEMRKQGSLAWEGDGPDRRYTVAREIRYYGDPESVDETGTKAAEHMAVAEALRKVERMLAASSAPQKFGRKNCEAMSLLVKALRAKETER